MREYGEARRVSPQTSAVSDMIAIGPVEKHAKAGEILQDLKASMDDGEVEPSSEDAQADRGVADEANAAQAHRGLCGVVRGCPSFPGSEPGVCDIR